jgi:hypothetical protein
MTSMLRSVGRFLASNLNSVEQGVHYHAGPAGAYACRSRRCVSPRHLD